jgi:hypothetical protein
MACSPVVGASLVHANSKTRAGRPPFVGGGRWGDHRTHCWALRQQARLLFVPCGGNRGGCIAAGDSGVVVESGVAPSWWWGVVFDLWIVVASIWRDEGMLPFFGGVCFVVSMCNFYSFLVFCVVSV